MPNGTSPTRNGPFAGPDLRTSKCTLPFDRARAWARLTKSSRLIAARNSRVTSFNRAASDRRSNSPCLASSPNSTVAAIWYALMAPISSMSGVRSVASLTRSA